MKYIIAQLLAFLAFTLNAKPRLIADNKISFIFHDEIYILSLEGDTK